jgi:hypothetical protein
VPSTGRIIGVLLVAVVFMRSQLWYLCASVSGKFAFNSLSHWGLAVFLPNCGVYAWITLFTHMVTHRVDGVSVGVLELGDVGTAGK